MEDLVVSLPALPVGLRKLSANLQRRVTIRGSNLRDAG